ncbi:response regulator [Chitinophaga defluvii]|uniref:Response regulator n=1 Tax=Chitinophaga defluvii TaxID=3163343 RepID=A0ABV2T7F3_9BACT
MKRSTLPRNILIADDDADDREMLKAAFEENKSLHNICFVEDGEELMHYLNRKGAYTDPVSWPLPGIIILDLNMPRMDGWEALRKIKMDEQLKCIPVIILSTSKAEMDVLNCYALGVNSFIIKPVTFKGLVEITHMLDNYWFKTAELPNIC